MLNKTMVSVAPPSEEFVFVQLGQSFYGYISQVSVWKTALTPSDHYEIYRDKLAVPQPDSLLLGWTQYSFDSSVKRTRSSTAAGSFSICNITDTIAKQGLDSQDCRSQSFTDKTPPQVNNCNGTALLPTSYSKHQVSSSELGYEFTDDTDGKLMIPERQFFSFGAYDIAVAAMDKEGNIGVCMTRAFITPNTCSDTEPSANSTEQCSDNPDGRKVACPDGLLPSVPTPKFVMCGKLLTYNLDNMYEQPDRIVCGVRMPPSVTVMVMLNYVIQVDCKQDVLSSVSNNIKLKIKDINKNWPGLCRDQNCSNVNVTSACSGMRMVKVNIQITSLSESLSSTAEMLTLTPLELMRKKVAERTPFHIQTIGGAQLMNMSHIDAIPSCEYGYGLTENYCVQGGPGTFYHEGEQRCKLCELNTFSNQSGSNRCIDCPLNHVTFQRGSSDINDCRINCSSGQMLNTTSDECVPCPKNFYQDNAGKHYCFPCPPTYGTENNGSSSVTQCIAFCRPGTELKGKECVECQRGYYRPGNLQDPCTPCSMSNMTTRGNGSISEDECNIPKCSPGYFVQGNMSLVCQPCDYGSYQPNEAEFECLPCGVNFTTENTASTNASMCRFVCPAGCEESPPESQQCLPCPRGSYRSEEFDQRIKNCTMCPDGFTTMSNGSTNITDCQIPKCSPGYFVQGNVSFVCQPCDYGSYQPNEAEFECLPCRVNFTTENITSTNASMCRFVCPPGHEESPPESQQCLPCRRGYYRSKDLGQRFKNCSVCPNGFTTMSTGSTNITDCQIPICMAGMYLNMTEGKCVKCPYNFYQNESLQESCHPCPKDYQTQTDGAVSIDNCTFVCPPGYEVNSTGKGCSICPRGTYKDESLKFESCQNCSSNITSDTEGAMNVTMCNVALCSKGYTVSADNATCLTCPVGTYQDMDMPLSTTVCQQCPQNTSTQVEASTSLNDCKVACEPGYGVSQGKCEPCQRGTWNSGNDTLQFLECQKCPVNFTTDVTEKAIDAANCSLRDCGPGTYFDNTTVECLLCEKGYYQNQSLQKECMMCPVNTSTRNTGTTTEEDCTIFCPAEEGGETGTCLRCGDDKYKDKADFGPCLNCTGEFTSTPSNRKVCTEIYCDKGREIKDGNCTDCVIGFYKPSRGNMACTKCPGNTTTPGNMSTSVSDCSVTYCEPGFFSNDNKTCIECPVGFYKNESGNQNCSDCPSNFTTNGSGKTSASDCSLVSCPQGHYRTSPGQCSPCPVGEYQNETGQTSCKSCGRVDGYERTTNTTGATSERDCLPICPAGIYLNISSKSCVPCPVSTYKDKKNLDTECTPCNNGNTTAGEGGTSSADCSVKICGKGYYRQPSSSVCKICPVGQFQDSATLGNIYACTPCKDNKTTLIEGSPGESYCVTNCPRGQEYKPRSMRCVACPIGQYRPAEAMAPPTCIYCQSDFTTLGRGESSCIRSISAARPSRITNVSVNATFRVMECGNPQALEIGIRKIIFTLLQNQNDKRYRSLCMGSCQSKVTIGFLSICGTVVRQKRQTTDKSAIATVTVNNVDPVLTDNNGNITRSTVAVIEEAFYDTEPAQSDLTTYQLTLVPTPVVDCGEMCVIDSDGNPQYCKPGQFVAASSCEPCAKGSYSTFPISKTCISCPEGQSTQESGADSVNLCDGKCAFEPGYCGPGTCSTNDAGKHFCTCTSGTFGPACEQREAGEDNNVKLVVGVCVGVGGLLMTTLGVFGVVAYMKNLAKKKLSKVANSASQITDSDASYKFPAMAHPRSLADPTMFSREVTDFQVTDSDAAYKFPVLAHPRSLADPTMFSREVIDLAQ